MNMGMIFGQKFFLKKKGKKNKIGKDEMRVFSIIHGVSHNPLYQTNYSFFLFVACKPNINFFYPISHEQCNHTIFYPIHSKFIISYL